MNAQKKIVCIRLFSINKRIFTSNANEMISFLKGNSTNATIQTIMAQVQRGKEEN